MDERTVEVIVVGGGQAGLALSRELDRRGVEFLIVDAGDGPGQSWRARWDSLRLFTSTGRSSLPGLPFPGFQDVMPGKDDVADYLAAYRAHFGLPVLWSTPVTSLQATPGTGRDGHYVLYTPGGELRARQVVIATGAFQRPWTPPLARQLDDAVCQVHAADYRHPGTWTCPACATSHDRDVNAARNILAAGRAERRNACGADVRPEQALAVGGEAGTHRGDQQEAGGSPAPAGAVGTATLYGGEDVKR